MGDLSDYSGKLVPDVRYESFSKDVLVKLLEQLNKNYLGLDGLWFQRAIKGVGLDEATVWSRDNWVTQCGIEMARIRELMNIQGDDVEALFKGIQLCSGFPIAILKWEMELANPNHGVITVHGCPAVDTFERWGDKGTPVLTKICKELEPPAFEAYVKKVNPNIKIIELMTPPRKSRDEPCCKWEFILEEE